MEFIVKEFVKGIPSSYSRFLSGIISCYSTAEPLELHNTARCVWMEVWLTPERPYLLTSPPLFPKLLSSLRIFSTLRSWILWLQNASILQLIYSNTGSNLFFWLQEGILNKTLERPNLWQDTQFKTCIIIIIIFLYCKDKKGKESAYDTPLHSAAQSGT